MRAYNKLCFSVMEILFSLYKVQRCGQPASSLDPLFRARYAPPPKVNYQASRTTSDICFLRDDSEVDSCSGEVFLVGGKGAWFRSIV